MKKLCFILGDQLNESLASLMTIDKQQDLVFFCEVREEATYVVHHPKKIAFLFSAMRHFAQQLAEQGYKVRYTKYTDEDNCGSFNTELEKVIRAEHITEVHVTHPGEWRVLVNIKQLSVPVIIHEDTRFLCSLPEFDNFAKHKTQLRMEYFYRAMRKQHNILMSHGQPLGGAWNYDKQNRKNANHIKNFTERLPHSVDAITAEVLELVAQHFSNHFGTLQPFNFAVTREQALQEAEQFITADLAYFGDYQDAMLANEIYLFHSRLSFYLNAGLLLPLELCKMAEQAYLNGLAPLNAVEGFIRQILGWREYVRGIYWLYMPAYAERNYFGADLPLPKLYWGGPTKMFCMQEVVRQTKQAAYSHHIQRLMITGNFALLAGINPQAVCDWYLAVYADAYEWVELPNTLGMALYADGGVMASKPYAASGNYIKKMSNFCKSCKYNPDDLLGETACPFNALYWNFIGKNKQLLEKNQRMHFAYVNWNKMSADKQTAIKNKAQEILLGIQNESI